ncbi:alpha/beta hydrolase [Cellulomonas marina]|uniref:Acetyl esterase/lipase n=1 Tax=Cellulomonas marina TaxID=988821 RepID=A0A1I0Z7H4_9CELL|nr:alpha/beta hydrolase [Cellulomonas marina]GIG29044.1 esterase [Cellulomonas marina]SFB21709.1 Acetyl esterase/lipase [Cellulomonas marina]
MAANPHGLSLEPAALAFAEATANPPYLYEMTPEEGRTTVDAVQDSQEGRPPVDETWLTVEGGPTGTVRVRVVRPPGATGTLPVILYTHGAGWVFGDAHTHDRLVRDLVVRTGAAVVFPEYDRSPEARYPVANEQSYATARWVMTAGVEVGLDASRMAVAGDSVGGNMAIALTLMAKERGDVSFVAQVLYYPVTDAGFDTPSYLRYADGYWLSRTGMFWFWDQYTTSEEDRARIDVSPLRATAEQLTGLPPALVVYAAHDVLLDDGLGYADLLRTAGVPVTHVTYAATIHDFVMLDAMHDTQAAQAAVAQAAAFLAQALEG